MQLADCTVELVCDAALTSLAARLRELLSVSVRAVPPSRTVTVWARASGEGGVRVTAESIDVLTSDESQATEQVLAAVNATVLPFSRLLTIHAGAVGAAVGVLAWPGLSGAGKSTLVAAALQRGYQLVSDEALCLDTGTGQVVAYPKPVTLDAWAVRRLGLEPVPQGAPPGEVVLGASDLGATCLLDAALVGAVVLLRRGTPTALVRVPADRAAAALLRHSFNHWRMAAAAVATVHEILRYAAVHELTYDDPRQAADLLVRELPPPR